MDEDFLCVKTDISSGRRVRNEIEQRNRDFIAGIIYQAFMDAKYNLPHSSTFLDPSNQLFVSYCNAIDLDPHRVASKLQKRLRELNERNTQPYQKNGFTALARAKAISARQLKSANKAKL
jgi:hypothetical protein